MSKDNKAPNVTIFSKSFGSAVRNSTEIAICQPVDGNLIMELLVPEKNKKGNTQHVSYEHRLPMAILPAVIDFLRGGKPYAIVKLREADGPTGRYLFISEASTEAWRLEVYKFRQSGRGVQECFAPLAAFSVPGENLDQTLEAHNWFLKRVSSLIQVEDKVIPADAPPSLSLVAAA